MKILNSWIHPITHRGRFGGRGGALSVEAPPPKFYNVQGRKLQETVVYIFMQ